MVDGAGTEIPRGMLRRRARFLVRGGCYATALSAPPPTILLRPKSISRPLSPRCGAAGRRDHGLRSRFQFTRRGACMSCYQSVTRPLGWVFCAGLLALLPAGLAAQEPVTISGKVTGWGGEPLRDVNVTIFDIGVGAWTGADGTYH